MCEADADGFCAEEVGCFVDRGFPGVFVHLDELGVWVHLLECAEAFSGFFCVSAVVDGDDVCSASHEECC